MDHKPPLSADPSSDIGPQLTEYLQHDLHEGLGGIRLAAALMDDDAKRRDPKRIKALHDAILEHLGEMTNLANVVGRAYETAARQSGRTTRLLEEACTLAREGHLVYFVVEHPRGVWDYLLELLWKHEFITKKDYVDRSARALCLRRRRPIDRPGQVRVVSAHRLSQAPSGKVIYDHTVRP